MLQDRELSSIEQAMEILNRRASSYYVVTICRIKGSLSEKIVRQALDLIQRHHSRLNSRIIGELDNLRFETGAMRIPLRVVEKLHSEQWEEIVLQELNQKIESDKYLMRAVFVQDKSENNSNINYLITTIHHAISDGSSRVRLHSEILTYCQKIVSGEPINQVPSLPPLPPIQELLPASMQGWKRVVNTFLFPLKAKLKQIWYRPQVLGFEKCVPIELRRCGMVYRKLNEEQTAQLLDYCRKKKTTMQGALCAALIFTAARKISGGKTINVRVSCWSTVDLRKRLKPAISNDNMGVLCSFIPSFHTDLLMLKITRDYLVVVLILNNTPL